eukprot:6846186-Ditylum_brightwellii.AAC.1
MSFGWKIVSALDKSLAEHSGLAFGHATSFQSEGYGLLSVARFLHHGSMSYSHDYPYNTLSPDWDLIALLQKISLIYLPG